MTLSDVPAVHTIERQVQTHPWSEKLFQDGLVAGHHATVMLNDQQVIGFCILQKVLDEANLLLMAIDPQWQQKGLGYQMLEHAIEQLGEGTAMVFLEVRQSNTAALALYEKIGFAQIDLRKNYYPTADGKEHAVIMALTRYNPFQM